MQWLGVNTLILEPEIPTTATSNPFFGCVHTYGEPPYALRVIETSQNAAYKSDNRLNLYRLY